MRRAIWVAICAVLVAVGLLASGCAEDAVQVELTETYVFPGFGFSIDYRAGWTAKTLETVTLITEFQADQTAFLGQGKVKGYTISLDHRDLELMRGIGLPADPSLEDLLEVNARSFKWEEPLERSETELFGVPAMRVRTAESYGSVSSVIGVVGEEMFVLTLLAPSEESLDSFMPVWDSMLASTRPAPE